MATTSEQQAAAPKQRNKPGSRRSQWYDFAPESYAEMESSFAIQQFHQRLAQKNRPPTDQQLQQFITVPDGSGADEQLWQYELLRHLCLQLNYYVVSLQPHCHARNGQPHCAEMKADEWLYLCASHPQPQNCCAIDYIVHSLDGATALLNSNKFFPSRISVTEGAVKQFSLIARRLYRIFAHAYFHHRVQFDNYERQHRLYELMVRASLRYDLVPEKLIIIPGYGFSGDEQTSSQAASDTSLIVDQSGEEKNEDPQSLKL